MASFFAEDYRCPMCGGTLDYFTGWQCRNSQCNWRGDIGRPVYVGGEAERRAAQEQCLTRTTKEDR